MKSSIVIVTVRGIIFPSSQQLALSSCKVNSEFCRDQTLPRCTTWDYLDVREVTMAVLSVYSQHNVPCHTFHEGLDSTVTVTVYVFP